jgi:hypothetical protein
MYDTLHLYLNREGAKGADLLALIPDLLQGLTESSKDGRYFVSGNFHNLRVSVSDQRLSIKGSLSKYYLGDNIQTLTRQDTQRGIERLSDELSLPLGDASLSRLDFGHNLIMKHEPEVYFTYLGESRYFERYRLSDSLNYKNGNRMQVFYDKVLESKFHRVEIPKVWQGKNVLRFESRYLKRIEDLLKHPDITANTLSDEQFYIGLVRRYFEDYEAIQKVLPDPLDYSNMTSPKDFWKQVALLQMQAWGQPKVMEMIDEMKARDTFKSPEYYSRLRREVKEGMGGSKAEISESLIAELDHKVKALKMFYR